MKLLHLILPSLLSHAASAAAKAAPVARQLTSPSDPPINSLAQRQAPSVSGPSTLTTATSTDSDLDLDLESDTTSTFTSPTATPTGPRNHNIAVGQNGTQFTPTVVKNIPIGDTLTFYFYPQNYSIIQFSFKAPCTPIKPSDGVDQRPLFSGFHPTLNSSSIAPHKFVVTVQSTDSMWIYAMDGTQLANPSTGTEKTVCERGMVMVVNPQAKSLEDGETLKVYRESAAGLHGDDAGVDVHVVPPDVWGGDVVALSERQRANWLRRHPLGGNVRSGSGNGTMSGSGSAYGNGVQSYRSGAERNVMFGRGRGMGKSLVAGAVVVGVGVVGVGW